MLNIIDMYENIHINRDILIDEEGNIQFILCGSNGEFFIKQIIPNDIKKYL